MQRTEEPPASVGQADLFTRLAEVAGVTSTAIAFAVLFSSDAQLRRWIPIALGASLALLGAAEFARARHRRGHKRELSAPREGYGRLCVALGLTQLLIAIGWPSVAAFTGVLVTGGLASLALRGPRRRGGRKRKALGRPGPGRLTIITIGFVLIAYVGLAGAVVGGRGNSPQGHQESEALGGVAAEPTEASSSGDEAEAMPEYADLCEVLPNPLVIGHGLGELFRHDGAVKAGCGTQAFQVPGTGTWVAAGMCFGERRSVAVSSPNRSPVIVYGEAAEFVWASAQEGELTAVEAAAPEGGDVILVETRNGTYGFARSARSATPGNEDARQCNEVGGSAEPFARMPPPLVWLWVELIRDQATWFWPTADRAGEGESVAFLSMEGVAYGSCIIDTFCELEFEGNALSLESITFAALDDLREYMPAEELPS